MDNLAVGLDFVSGLSMNLSQSLGDQWLGIALWQYLVALLFLTLTFFARRAAELVLQRIVLPWINNVGAVYTGKFLEALIKPLTALLGLFGLFLAANVLLQGEGAGADGLSQFISQSFQVAVAGIVVWAITRLIDVFAAVWQERAQEGDAQVDVPVITLLKRSLKVLIVVLGILLVIQYLGYPITSLLGGLGIGGLAVALAAQDALSNIFGSVIVFTDKPFKVGDWVRIGDVEGFVEDVGFRSTRIRTWAKSLVTIPNKEIANSRIENWTAMPVRRISFTLTIAYDAPRDKLEALVDGIRQFIANHAGIDQAFHLVAFSGFGENGYEIMVYCFTRSVAWVEHMEIRQELNVEIMRLLQSLGLAIAIPSRRIYFARSGEGEAAAEVSQAEGAYGGDEDGKGAVSGDSSA